MELLEEGQVESVNLLNAGELTNLVVWAGQMAEVVDLAVSYHSKQKEEVGKCLEAGQSLEAGQHHQEVLLLVGHLVVDKTPRYVQYAPHEIHYKEVYEDAN